MIHMMSWGEFVGLLSVLTLVYYGLVGYFLYRREMERWSGPKESEPGPKILPLHAGGLMGIAKPTEEGVEVVDAEELNFAEVAEAEAVQVAVIPSVADEVKELIAYAAGAKESKEGLLTLLGLYLDRSEFSQKKALAELMLDECKEKFSFELNLADLNLGGGEGGGEGDGAGIGATLKKGLLALLILVSGTMTVWAQDGNSGIAEATSKVRSYFATGCNLMYAIGAVIGLIGAVKVYQKWNGGDGDTGKVAASWFGSCIFLVVVATVLQSFFGI